MWETLCLGFLLCVVAAFLPWAVYALVSEYLRRKRLESLPRRSWPVYSWQDGSDCESSESNAKR